jgi:hypothetical protein
MSLQWNLLALGHWIAIICHFSATSAWMLISKDEIACAWTAVFLSVEVVSQKAFL